MTIFELAGLITIDNKSAIGSINATETAADKASGKMGTSFGKVGGLLKGALVGGAIAAGTALVAMGVKGVQGASELEGATDRIQAALGITEGEAKRLGGVAQDVFVNAFAGSVTEAAGMVQILRQQLGDMSDEQTSKLTQMAATISDVYGADYAQTINTAKTLTEQFGLSNEEAFDFITQGFQKGLDSSGDFLDSVNEYSTQFANGGADAGEFFSIMESGLQGGALGTDKAADAFKEFRLRVQDGSKLTGESLAMLGINADDLAAKISSGQMTAADAFQLVITKLGETEDPMVRMQAGAGLIGSQFEDLGDNAVQQLSMTTTSLEDMAGATDAAGKAAYDNLGTKLTSLWRIMQTGLTDALGPLIPVVTEFVDVLIERAPLMIDAGKQVATYISTWAPHITQLIGTIGPVVTDVFGLMAAAWTNVVRPVWDTIAPLVAGMFGALGNSIRAFKLVLEDDFVGAWSEAVEGLKSFLTGLEGFLENFFGGLWNLVKPGLIGMRDVILAKGEEIRDGFSEKLTELKRAVFEWSVDLWADIAATMSSFVGHVVNAALEVYNGFTDGFYDLRDKTVEIIGALWGNIKSGLETFTQNIVDEIMGIPGKIGDLGSQIVSKIVEGLTGEKGALRKAAQERAEEVPEAFRSELDIRSPSKVLYKIGQQVVQGLTGGMSDPAEIPRVQTAATDLGQRVLTSTLDALGITQPENPYHLAGQAMIQGVIDGAESRMPQLKALFQRIQDARPDVNVMTGWTPGGPQPSANVTPSVPLVTPEATAVWGNLVNVVLPQVAAAFGKLVSIDMPNVSVGLGKAVDIMSVQATAAGTARLHAVIGENQREWQARETERQARAIAADTQNAMATTHLAQMQSGALGAQAWVQATLQNTTSFLSGAVSWVGSTLSGAASWIGSTVSEAAGHIYQAAVGIGTELVKLAFNEVPGLGAAMNAMAGGPMAMLIAYFVDLISSTWQFQAIIDGATAIMQPLIDTMGRLIEAIWPLISVVFARLEVAVNAIAWVFDKILNPAINFVARTIASVWNALARTLNRVLGWLGVNIPTINVNAGPVKPPSQEQQPPFSKRISGPQSPAIGSPGNPGGGYKPPKTKPYKPPKYKAPKSPGYKAPKQPGYKAPKQPGQKGYKPPKGYKAPGAPGRPGSPGYKAPKIGSPGSGSGGMGGGSGGTKVSEITGPTRDFLADAFSSFTALPQLVGIGNRTYSLLEANLGPMSAVVGAPALNAGPNITNHIHMVASGDLRYDADQLTKEVSLRLAKAMQAQKRGSGG